MRDEDCLEALSSIDATLTWLGGYCPVQAEGEVDGSKFYFRSRGDTWSLSIDKKDPLDENAEFYYEESYGKWPEAGYIEDSEALSFIKRGIEKWRTERE